MVWYENNRKRNLGLFVAALLVAGVLAYRSGQGQGSNTTSSSPQSSKQISSSSSDNLNGISEVAFPPLVNRSSKSWSERWREWRAPAHPITPSPGSQIGTTVPPEPIDNWGNQDYLIFGPTSPYTAYNEAHNSSHRRPLYPGDNIEIVPKQSHYNPSIGYVGTPAPTFGGSAVGGVGGAGTGTAGNQHHHEAGTTVTTTTTHQRKTKLQKESNIALANAKWNRWVRNHSSSKKKDKNTSKDTYGLTYYYALNPCWRDSPRQGGIASAQSGALTIYNENSGNETLTVISVSFTTNSKSVIPVAATSTTNAASGSLTFPAGTFASGSQGSWTWTPVTPYDLNARSASLTISMGMFDCDPATSTVDLPCVIPFAVPPYNIMVTLKTGKAEATVYGMCAMFVTGSSDYSACMDGTYRATGTAKKIGTYFPEWGFWNNYFPVKVTSIECINNFMPLPYSYGEPTLYLPAVDIVYYGFIVPGMFVPGIIPNTVQSQNCLGNECYLAVQNDNQFDVYDPVSSPYNLATWMMIKRQYPYLTLSLSFGGWSLSYPFTQFNYNSGPTGSGGLVSSVFNYLKFAALAASALSQLKAGDVFLPNPDPKKYGIDIDWEYPGTSTRICYTIPPPSATSTGIYYCYNVTDIAASTDVATYSNLLKGLRTTVDGFVSAALPGGVQEINNLAPIFSNIVSALDSANIMFYDYHGQFDIGGKSDFMAPFKLSADDPYQNSSTGKLFSVVGTMTTYQSLSPSLYSTFIKKVSVGLPNYGRLEQVETRGACDTNASDSTLYVPLMNFTQSTGMGEQNDLSSLWSYRCLFGLFNKNSTKYCIKQKLNTADYPETSALLESLLSGNMDFAAYDASQTSAPNYYACEAWANGTEVYQDGGTNFIFLSWDDVNSIAQKISQFDGYYPGSLGVFFWSSDEDLQTSDADFQDASLLLVAQQMLSSLSTQTLSANANTDSNSNSNSQGTSEEKALYYNNPYLSPYRPSIWANPFLANPTPNPYYYNSPSSSYSMNYFPPQHYYYHREEIQENGASMVPISSQSDTPSNWCSGNNGNGDNGNQDTPNDQGGSFQIQSQTNDETSLLVWIGVVFVFSLFLGVSFWIVCGRVGGIGAEPQNRRRKHRR